MASNKKLGATAGEWQHFIDLGLWPAMLPVVADPDADIKAGSTLKQMGKVPSRYDSNGLAVGFGRWPEYVAEKAEVARWAKDGRYSISINCRAPDGWSAIDVDVADAALAGRIFDWLEMWLERGFVVRYRANSGKFLIPFKAAGNFGKRRVFVEGGMVEILSTGQQFVAAGTHTSGVPYAWRTSTGEARLPVLDDLPRMTESEIDRLVEDLTEGFGIAAPVKAGSKDGEARAAVAKQIAADPLVRHLHDRGWVQRQRADLGLDIHCPFEEEHTGGETATSATTFWPAGTGGFLQPHFKCMHAHCAHRTDADFVMAVGWAEVQRQDLINAFPVVEGTAFDGSARAAVEEEVDSVLSLPRDKQGRVPAELRHVRAALNAERMMGIAIRFDTYKHVGLFDPGHGPRPVTDADEIKLRQRLEEPKPFHFRPVGRELMRDALTAHYDDHKFDSAVAWLEHTLPVWDGVPRVERLLIDYLGAVDKPYTREVGRYLMTALVGRMLAVKGGIKADMVPILVGQQGAGKSTFLAMLAPTPEEYVELDLSLNEADRVRHTHGACVVELGELVGFDKREQNEHKAWFSRAVDEYVPKYANNKQKVPRRFVCVGTTNRDQFLQDESGERRYLPIVVTALDREALARDKAQLYAEALTIFKTSGIAYREAERLARDEHANFKVVETWEGPIAAYLDGVATDDLAGGQRKEQVTIGEVAAAVLGKGIGQVSKRDGNDIAKILRTLGWTNKDQKGRLLRLPPSHGRALFWQRDGGSDELA